MIPGGAAGGFARPPIVFVGAVSAAATSVALMAHKAGDIFLAQAIRDGDETSPSLAAGWTNIFLYDPLVNLQARYAYKIAASAGETSGTWADAHGIGIMAFRNVSGIGDSDARQNDAQPTTIPNLSLQVVNGSSVVVCFVASRGTGADYATGVPAGLTNRFARIIPAGGCFGGHHSAAVSSFAQVTQAPGGTARNYGFAVELKKKLTV